MSNQQKRARQKAGRAARLEALEKDRKRKLRNRRGITFGVIILVGVGIIALVTTTGSPSNKKAGSNKSTTTTPPTASQFAAAQSVVDQASEQAGCPASISGKLDKQTYKSAPAFTISTSKTYTAVVKTDVGTITIALDAKQAPQTVNNFVFLAEHKFYNCVIFHRVIPTFMDQTGDPLGTGNGGPGYTIPDEYPKKVAAGKAQYPLGSVAMANTGQPHSGGSQFFIVTGAEGEALAPSYTIFGQVTSGMSVAQKINQDGTQQGVPPNVTHRMLSVTITTS